MEYALNLKKTALVASDHGCLMILSCDLTQMHQRQISACLILFNESD